MMPLSLGQRAILPCLAVMVNGCAQMGREAVPPEIARHAPLAPLYAHRFPLGAAVEPRHVAVDRRTQRGAVQGQHRVMHAGSSA